MAFTTLPPVWNKWTEDDINKLTIEEIERLHLWIYQKLFLLEMHAEQQTIFYEKNKKSKDYLRGA